MKKTKIVAALSAVAGFALSVQATPIGIINGDFEADGDNATPPTGWTDHTPTSFASGIAGEPGNANTNQYDAVWGAGTWGSYFLTTARQSWGGASQPSDGLLTQTVDLSAFGTDIDNGDQQLLVDFLWASGDFNDTGAFSLDFFASTDGTGSSVQNYSVALDAADNYNVVGGPESVGGAVPAGVRSVTLSISSHRGAGSETNLWIDNVSGDIAAIPEPATLGLVGIFGAGVLFIRRRFMI